MGNGYVLVRITYEYIKNNGMYERVCIKKEHIVNRVYKEHI